jgi:hypothetical protein
MSSFLLSSEVDNPTAYDSDDELIMLYHEYQLLFFQEHMIKKRKQKWIHDRIAWMRHLDKEGHSTDFETTYRFSFSTFEMLKAMLGEIIEIDPIQSRNSSGSDPIIPEVVMACGIRWLAGGSYSDIKNAYGLSRATFYRLRDLFIDAICDCKELDIKLPNLSDPNDIDRIRRQFEEKSSNGIMRGCVGAVDGMLQEIQQPSYQDSEGNPRAYHSGHYNCPGLNVLAMCDARLRFTFFGILKPGSTSDLRTYEFSSLPQFVEALPDGTYIVGDAAFMVSEHLLIPFTGSSREVPEKDVFNFYLSQLRIRIEMAFGLLTNKWRVLRRPMQNGLRMNAKVLEACARLHNFVIENNNTPYEDRNEEFESAMSIEPMDNSPLGWGYLPTVRPLEHMQGNSQTRQVILDHIKSLGLRRPQANIERRRKSRDLELHEIGLM